VLPVPTGLGPTIPVSLTRANLRTPEADPMKAPEIKEYLRRCGVTVHHASQLPVAEDGTPSVAVFLETTLDQYELARASLLRLPQVERVVRSGAAASVLFVFGGRPDAVTALLAPSPPPPTDLLEYVDARSSRHGRPGPDRSPQRHAAGPPGDREAEQRKVGATHHRDLGGTAVLGAGRFPHRHLPQRAGRGIVAQEVTGALPHRLVRDRHHAVAC
jgi:hypothetical protein